MNEDTAFGVVGAPVAGGVDSALPLLSLTSALCTDITVRPFSNRPVFPIEEEGHDIPSELPLQIPYGQDATPTHLLQREPFGSCLE